MLWAALLLLTSLRLFVQCLAQLSNPIADNGHISVTGNKFLERDDESRSAEPRKSAGNDELTPSDCPQNIQLKWMSEATSSIYATPVITDLYADGFKDIVVASFVHNLEVFQGDNGAQAAGFPAVHVDKVHASPLLYDADHDGVQDILVSTYNGEIIFYQDTGKLMPLQLSVPRLKVSREWYVGLAKDHVDHSHPDVPEVLSEDGKAPDISAQNVGASIQLTELHAAVKEHHEALLSSNQTKVERQKNETTGERTKEQEPKQGEGEARENDSVSRRLQQKSSGEDSQTTPGVESDPEGRLSKEALQATKSLEYDGDEDDGDPMELAQDYLREGVEDYLDVDHERVRQLPFDRRNGGRPFLEDYDGYMHYMDEHGWDYDEIPTDAQHMFGKDIALDAHIMCTPTIADIDADGNDDLIIPVSYFFDRAHYDSAQHRIELPPDLDLSMYLASGIVVFDLVTHAIKWSQHLDLTTDQVEYRAYVYSTPTVVDIDHDGYLEVIVATSVGFIYVLNHYGDTVSGWPKQMAEVQAQVAVADVDGDEFVELLAMDTKGNVALWNVSGHLLWDVHVSAPVTQAATFADINGDGRLEVVFGTGSGEVWALDAITGKVVDGFPFETSGRIVAPVTVTRLADGPSQQLLVSSFDGFLYIIDGITICADAIDVGDTSYTSVLVDDLDNDGYMELLLSTMSGHIYSFGTPSEYHPLKVWPQQVLGHAGFVAQHDEIGVYASETTRIPKDIRGETFPVEFSIIDRLESPEAVAARATSASVGAEFKMPRAPYRVKAVLTSIDTASMNSGEQPIIGMTDVYQLPGTYTLHLPCPKSRATALIRLELQDNNGIMYVHEFPQSFHMHFDKLLKWLVAAPLLAMGLFLLVLQPDGGGDLPM